MNGRGFLMRAWIAGLLIAGMHTGTAGAQTAGLGIQPSHCLNIVNVTYRHFAQTLTKFDCVNYRFLYVLAK